MGKTNQFLETVDQIATDGINKGIFHLYTEDTVLEGNRITLKGKSVINFGSCSYLGLEFDERLKNAAKQAVDDYGTQFSESRAYVSTRHYQELETLLNRLFEAHCVVAPTTTLGHIATIPVVVGDTDAVIMDHQVHSSVQTAVQLLKARGVYVELLRHNRMDLLEERVRALRGKHAKIWYMADGVYSMYGDKSPMDDLYALLNKYTHLHLYVDDAHGMSIYGKHGRGHVLNNRAFHPKMVLGTSLNKAFAAGGGVMLFPTAPMAQKVRACGGPLITSGPMQPGALGAALASARIHLSPEIVDMQQDLQENIRFTQLMIKKHGLPLISESGSAVFFIGVSLPKLGYNLVKRMLNAGYYLNLGIFPAVPIKNTGVRFTITRLHTFAQIEAMIATMAAEFPKALAEEGLSLQQIYKAFKLPLPEELELDRAVRSVVAQSLELTVCHTRTIQSVDKKKWNALFADKGNFDWDSLLMMERSFGDNELAEHNWKFDYLLVSDRAGLPVAATFLTTALYKDDVLAPAGVSRQIEQKRLIDPYYLTSTVIAAGSPVTEGEQFYIDKNNPLWQNAVQLIFEKIYLLQEQYKATSIMLRDFVGEDRAMDDFFVNNGFFKMALPDCYTAPTWNGGTTGFVKQLSANGKRHYKKYIERHADKFDLQIHTTASPADIEHWYNLYCNTQSNKLELNTFTIPPKFFANLMQCSGWEAITLTVKPMYDFEGIGKAVAVVFAKKTATQYIPLIIGMDYGYKDIYHTYRQALYQVMQRAHQLGCQQVRLGFSSGIEKSKIGGKPYATYAYAQVKDTFNMEAIAVMSAFATNNEKK